MIASSNIAFIHNTHVINTFERCFTGFLFPVFLFVLAWAGLLVDVVGFLFLTADLLRDFDDP